MPGKMLRDQTIDELRESYFEKSFNNIGNFIHEKKQLFILETNRSNILYKYCPIETAIKIVDKGFILCQLPNVFKDSYDCLAKINIWNQRFGMDKIDKKKLLIFLDVLINKIPSKFQLSTYSVHKNIRTAICFYITCFTTHWNNLVMWDEYADASRGVCFAYEIDDSLLQDLYPCYYTHNIPENLDLSTTRVSVALFKTKLRSFESEWRCIKNSIIPLQIGYRSIANEIAASIRKASDYEEWLSIDRKITGYLEDLHENKQKLFIAPSRIYLGPRFSFNESNEKTREQWKKIIYYALGNNIPIYKTIASHKSFDLKCELISNDYLYDFYQGKIITLYPLFRI